MPSVDELIGDLYSSAFTVDAFVRWTSRALDPYGFTAANTLPLVGLCRDELMFPIEQALHEAWGLPFDMSSLGGMVFLGRSGVKAAANHAPGVDGRNRYLCVVLPHIGLDAIRGVGYVQREGIDTATSACGALMAFHKELSEGTRNHQLDHDDMEMSLLRIVLSPLVATDAVPDLAALTELARSAAAAEVVRLAMDLLESPTADVAMVSGLAIHGPDGDRLAVREAWIRVGSGEPIPLVWND
jgi:hypothetical protein